MKTILLITLIFFSGCAGVLGHRLSYYKDLHPDELESWIKFNLPYVLEFYDCRERAEFAVKALRRQGCVAEVKYQLIAKQSRLSTQRQAHNYAHYVCPKYGEGNILDFF